MKNTERYTEAKQCGTIVLRVLRSADPIQLPDDERLETHALAVRSMLRQAERAIQPIHHYLPEWLRCEMRLSRDDDPGPLVAAMKTSRSIGGATELVAAHAKLIAAYVAQYRQELRPQKIENLVAIACEGLGRAAIAYDPTRLHAFSTIASWHMREAFVQAMIAETTPQDDAPAGGNGGLSLRNRRDAERIRFRREIEEIREWDQDTVTETILDDLRARANGGVSFSLVLAVTARHFGLIPRTVLMHPQSTVGRRAYQMVMLLGHACVHIVLIQLADVFNCEVSTINANIASIREHLGDPEVYRDLEAICRELGVATPHGRKQEQSSHA